MGITSIGLADTLGTTLTERVISAVGYVLDAEPDLNYSLHLHNAHGQALTTVSAALDLGITRFDSALGGYGGCPFAPGAAGNLATEELVRHLHGTGHETGIDEARLAETVAYARESVTRAPALSAVSASH
jgi:hydroxymethylglutaryl-CoA lyase